MQKNAVGANNDMASRAATDGVSMDGVIATGKGVRRSGGQIRPVMQMTRGSYGENGFRTHEYRDVIAGSILSVAGKSAGWRLAVVTAARRPRYLPGAPAERFRRHQCF